MLKGPPFDDSPACPCCSAEIRNLYAVAHNITVGAADTTIGDLKNAVESVKPLVDAHFASSLHAVETVEDHDDESMTPLVECDETLTPKDQEKR